MFNLLNNLGDRRRLRLAFLLFVMGAAVDALPNIGKLCVFFCFI